MNYLSCFLTHKEKSLSGRYITLFKIETLLQNFSSKNELSVLGYSVLQKPIYMYKVGSGKIKLLFWSQMHGNECTTTKALFDLFNFLESDTKEVLDWKSNFTFFFVPMLNPDGAELYTRENANKVDLNRDFLHLSQPESQLLFRLFKKLQPDFCFNLHDQRTVFGAGKSNNPATVSFLAPSFNEERAINEVRQKAINLIVGINNELQKHIPNQIGRFDDSYNRNCVGDTFQQLEVATVLFEAGHFQNDYQREETRKFIFVGFLKAIELLYENDIVDNKTDDYLKIPQNNICFFDFVCRNVKINYENSNLITNFAVQFKEEIVGDEVVFTGYIESVGELEDFFGHIECNAHQELYKDDENNFPIIGKKANFSLGNDKIFVNGLIKN